MLQMGWSPVLLCLLVLTVLASAKEFVLEDLIAEEDNPDNRRVIHNVGQYNNLLLILCIFMWLKRQVWKLNFINK